jgi:lipopolysaccharide transport system permease protein
MWKIFALNLPSRWVDHDSLLDIHLMPTTGLLRLIAAPVVAPLAHRSLIWELTKREVMGRYRGASFGLLWSLISPFLLLGVYSFAFGSVMKGRWPQSGDQGANQHSFTLILFVGLIVHGFFSEVIMRGPMLITGNPSYVKRIIFPLDILPWPMILSALFHLVANFLVFLALRLVLEGHIDASAILFPIIILPLVVLAFGVSWLLAALGVYFRDVTQITSVLSTALLFTSSAVMPISSVSPSLRPLFMINPITFIIDQSRNIALWDTMPNWEGLGLYMLLAMSVALVGFTWFMATRRGFADVI